MINTYNFEDVEEIKRLQTLLSYNIPDTPPQEEFDGLVKLISPICNSPIANISLIDDKRQWYKAKIGVSHNEVPKAKILCQYTLQQEDIMEVPDAREDVRVKNNPYVIKGGGIRYYTNLVEEPKEQKILSLSALEELSDGNKEFKDHVMGLFILQAKEMYEEIKVFYEANDREGIKFNAHKLKTSFGIIGADIKFLVELENSVESNRKTSELHKSLTSLESQLTEIYGILKELIITPAQ